MYIRGCRRSRWAFAWRGGLCAWCACGVREGTTLPWRRGKQFCGGASAGSGPEFSSWPASQEEHAEQGASGFWLSLDAVQPWECKGYKKPGGTPSNAGAWRRCCQSRRTVLRSKNSGVLSARRRSSAPPLRVAQVDFDTAQLHRDALLLPSWQPARWPRIDRTFLVSALNQIKGWGGSRPNGFVQDPHAQAWVCLDAA